MEGFDFFGLCGAHSRSLLPMLQAEHSTWRLSKAVQPPFAQGLIWSICSVTAGSLAGLVEEARGRHKSVALAMQ